jgi:hypothetical protein
MGFRVHSCAKMSEMAWRKVFFLIKLLRIERFGDERANIYASSVVYL